jgi:hypothetical protein
MQLLFAALGALIVVIAVWFWVHCAQPMLRYQGAGPITMGLLFAVTIYTVVAEAVFIAATAVGHGTQLMWFIAGLPWLLIVALPYLDDYRILVRIGGGR